MRWQTLFQVCALIIPDCDGEKLLKLVNRKQRYCKNESGTVISVYGIVKFTHEYVMNGLKSTLFYFVSSLLHLHLLRGCHTIYYTHAFNVHLSASSSLLIIGFIVYLESWAGKITRVYIELWQRLIIIACAGCHLKTKHKLIGVSDVKPSVLKLILSIPRMRTLPIYFRCPLRFFCSSIACDNNNYNNNSNRSINNYCQFSASIHQCDDLL